MNAVQSVFSNLFGMFPIDFFVIAIVLIVAALDAFRNGTRRAAVFALAAPLAIFLYEASFKTAFIAGTLLSLNSITKAAFFGAIFVFLGILLYRIVPASFGSGALPVQGLAAGLAVAIVLPVVWLQIPALVSLWTLSPMIQTIFGPAYRVFWLLGAYLALAFVRR